MSPKMEVQKYVPTWKAEPLANRLHRSMHLLYVHGVLTDSQRVKVKGKIERWHQTGHDRAEVDIEESVAAETEGAADRKA